MAERLMGHGHIGVMQLFYELKQKFPAAPDPVVSECIRQSRHDPERCEALLRASCASRGFLAATAGVVHTSPTRRFSAPPSGVLVARSSSGSSAVSLEPTVGRNSMCALPERATPCTSSAAASAAAAVAAAAAAAAAIPTAARPPLSKTHRCDSPQTVKLRPTFLNTRTHHHQKSIVEELRPPPFIGSPLQESHHQHHRRYECYNASSSSGITTNATTSPQRERRWFVNKDSKPQCRVFEEKRYSDPSNWGEAKYSDPPYWSPSPTNTEPRVPEWPPRDIPVSPPPPPTTARPSVPPSSMVQEPLLPPFCHLAEEQYVQDYEVSVNCSVRGLHVTSTCSSPVSALPPSRHTASLHVHPSPHFLPRPGTLKDEAEPRSYTSVNLTLRSPSSEPQPAIDIRSASRLTYSTSSFNPRQGFQSQLHIQIGAGGGSVSALRTNHQAAPASRPVSTPQTSASSAPQGPKYTPAKKDLLRASSLPDVYAHSEVAMPCQAGLARQMERKARLERELQKEREKLNAMQREVKAMEMDLQRRNARKAISPLPSAYSAMQRVEELRAEILELQEECKRMTQEVDLHAGSQVPLGETDEEFYENIYTGQRGFILPPQNLSQGSWQLPPPRSTPPLPPHEGDEDEEGGSSGEDEDGPHWTCSVCTFRNHPALGKCEQCEMPRISLDEEAEADTQDIHIRVTHHNFPARRVVHSWVV